ncbi:hypothetical protein HG263_19390 [Pseudoalteromonas sp. JBTF-M23]|uniref:NlpE-like protein n=1 Tax=Pseudoalteromonas caenipelagi TaxID=2726988 RepID=A0A849VJP3_9GAMM|nr:hypothetical protein [Pseudoalteromonas caenipelagi]NOU52673.1 hypothetical protein [Pseudoalteromonas caenipelagi]
MKRTSILLGVSLVAGCNHLATSQAAWTMTKQGLTYQGKLIDQHSAKELTCSECVVTQQTMLTPFGPSYYTKLHIGGQLKAIWGQSPRAELFIPNNTGRTLITLKKGQQPDSWQALFNGKRHLIYSAQSQQLTIGAVDYTLLVTPSKQAQNFTYNLLVNRP